MIFLSALTQALQRIAIAFISVITAKKHTKYEQRGSL